ncbi:hypothetical protein [Coleofasciculus sp.]
MMKLYQKKARSHGFGLSAISFACAEGNRLWVRLGGKNAMHSSIM